MATRSKDFLVVPQPELVGSKLLSNGDVLAVILHHLHLKKTSLRVIAPMVVRYWSMARIPMTRKDNMVTKLDKLHRKYELLKKGKHRRSKPQVAKEAFKVKLDNLFDVAHADALKMMTNAEDKAFLLAQREPGRRGKMGNVVLSLLDKKLDGARELQKK